MLKNLKILRNEKGISQQKLASAISVSQQSVNKYENHDIEPDIETLKKLADYFETSIDYLIGYTDIKHKIEKIYKYELNENESKLVNNFRELNKRQKEATLHVIMAFLNN